MPFADLALARLLEEAWTWSNVESARVHARRQPESAVGVEALAGGFAVAFGPGMPLSQAQGLGLNGPVAEAEIDRMETFFRERECPARVEVATPADPSLLALLGRREYRVEEVSHVLARELHPGAVHTLATTEARVEQIAPNEDAAALWAETVMDSFFEGPEGPPDAMVALGTELAFTPGTSCWLARIGGAPAGGGALTVHQDTALLSSDGTLPAFRGRGVQSALLRARLAAAVALGCARAAISTRPAGPSQRNAERLGFRLVYARILFVRELQT